VSKAYRTPRSARRTGGLELWLTTEEARVALRLTRRESVTDAIRGHRLRGARKVGRAWLVPRWAVEVYKVSRRHQANALSGPSRRRTKVS